MFGNRTSRPIRRAELKSPDHSPAQSRSPSPATTARIQAHLAWLYAEEPSEAPEHKKEKPKKPKSKSHELSKGHHSEDDGESFEFRLFSTPKAPVSEEYTSEKKGKKGKKRKATEQPKTAVKVTKIRILSKSPEPKNGGFINPRRPSSYYFTRNLNGPKSKAQQDEEVEILEQFRDMAIDGDTVTCWSHQQWPGNFLPWRASLLPSSQHRVSEAGLSPAGASYVDLNVARKPNKPNKRRRLVLHQREQKEREAAEQKARLEEEKEKEEREKKTQRNREKKVKKKARDKAKKMEAEAEAEGMQKENRPGKKEMEIKTAASVQVAELDEEIEQVRVYLGSMAPTELMVADLKLDQLAAPIEMHVVEEEQPVEQTVSATSAGTEDTSASQANQAEEDEVPVQEPADPHLLDAAYIEPSAAASASEPESTMTPGSKTYPKPAASEPEPAAAEYNASPEAPKPQQRRSRLDLASSRRLIYGSLGLRLPRSNKEAVGKLVESQKQ